MLLCCRSSVLTPEAIFASGPTDLTLPSQAAVGSESGLALLLLVSVGAPVRAPSVAHAGDDGVSTQTVPESSESNLTRFWGLLIQASDDPETSMLAVMDYTSVATQPQHRPPGLVHWRRWGRILRPLLRPRRPEGPPGMALPGLTSATWIGRCKISPHSPPVRKPRVCSRPASAGFTRPHVWRSSNMKTRATV